MQQDLVIVRITQLNLPGVEQFKMNDPLPLQQTMFYTVSRALENFKKIGRNNYTAAKIRSRMTFLKETWAQCRQTHAAILQLYPEGKREKMDYF